MIGKILKSAVMLCLMVLPLISTSCGEGKDNDPEIPDNPVIPGNNDPDPDVPDNPHTPDEGVYSSKDAFNYICQTAKEAIALFNPDDQKEAIEACIRFGELYGDYDMPEDMGAEYSPVHRVHSLAKALSGGNPGGLTRAGYTITFSDFTGIYEPDVRNLRWVKTGNSQNVIFRCNVNGKTFEINVSGTEGNWMLETDGDYVEVPRKIVTIITYGGVLLANVTAETYMNLDAHQIRYNVRANVSNLSVSDVMEGSDSRISETKTVLVGGKTVASANAVIEGTHLCDLDYLETTDSPEKLINSGKLSSNVMDKVFVEANVQNASVVIDLLGFYESSWGDLTQRQAVSQCQTACERINQLTSANVRFTSGGPVQGSLLFTPGLYTYGSSAYWEVEPSPAIRYAYDGSVEIIGDVDHDFGLVVSAFNSLVRKYDNLVNSLLRR